MQTTTAIVYEDDYSEFELPTHAHVKPLTPVEEERGFCCCCAGVPLLGNKLNDDCTILISIKLGRCNIERECGNDDAFFTATRETRDVHTVMAVQWRRCVVAKATKISFRREKFSDGLQNHTVTHTHVHVPYKVVS